MRTTVTPDPDVEALLRARIREQGVSFKQALNDALREGLTSRRRRRRLTRKVYSLGSEQLFRWDKALAAADAIEDEELTRMLSLHK